MKKTLLAALALVALPLAGCADDEVIDQATPATDAPVVEETVVTDPALEAGDVTEEALTEEALTEEAAPIEGETPAEVAPATDGDAL